VKFGELIQVRTLLGILSLMLQAYASAQTNPSEFDNVVQKAITARNRDDLPQAVTLYSQAVRLHPEWPEGWWFLGSLQYESEAYAQARDALTHYIELAPDAGPAWALRGLSEFETGEYRESLADLRRGLSLGAGKQPRDEKILRYHVALLLTRNGNFEGALQEYASLARSKVPNPELLVAIGLAGLRIPLLPGQLEADKHELLATAGNAAFLYMSGDEKAAQQQFQKLFQRFPAAANAHYLYGYLLLSTDPDQATNEFSRELEISPSNAPAQLMVAWDSLMRNDFGTALTYAEKAVAEEPKLPVAQLVLGRALLETGDVKAGTEVLEKELQVEPENLEIHFGLAKAYSKSGRKEDARRERLLCLQMERSATNQQGRR
jgi:tetratricopeptide (TPR) repeat protein